MSLSRGIAVLLVLAALDQWARGLGQPHVVGFSSIVLASQAALLACALLLMMRLALRQNSVCWWQILVSAGCLSGLVERAFFGEVHLPLALVSTGKSDWTAFAFADMYILTGAIAAYWKHELEETR